jgi:hypothetical protein
MVEQCLASDPLDESHKISGSGYGKFAGAAFVVPDLGAIHSNNEIASITTLHRASQFSAWISGHDLFLGFCKLGGTTSSPSIGNMDLWVGHLCFSNYFENKLLISGSNLNYKISQNQRPINSKESSQTKKVILWKIADVILILRADELMP